METKADSGLKKQRKDKECQEESADRVEGLVSDVDIASGPHRGLLVYKHNLLQLTQEHSMQGMLKGLAHSHLR